MLFHEEIEKKGQKFTFKDLPIEAQKAIVYYKAVDGSLWSDLVGDNPLECDDDWQCAIDSVCKSQPHADKLFTLYEMPRQRFADLIMQTPSDFAGWHDTFEEYHQWYINGDYIPEYKKEGRWPALAWCDTEGLVDGWHRTHAYYRDGHETIPLIL